MDQQSALQAAQQVMGNMGQGDPTGNPSQGDPQMPPTPSNVPPTHNSQVFHEILHILAMNVPGVKATKLRALAKQLDDLFHQADQTEDAGETPQSDMPPPQGTQLPPQ